MRTFKNTLVAIMLMVVTVTLTSCGGSTPQGNDKEVKALVKQIYQSEFEKWVFSKTYDRVVGSLNKQDEKSADSLKSLMVRTEFVEFGQIEKPGKYFTDYNKGYDDLISRIKNEDDLKFYRELFSKYEPKLKEFVDTYAELANDSNNFKIENIRAVSVDKESKKSVSKADLYIFDFKREITYSAQRNAEGEIYVEVFSN